MKKVIVFFSLLIILCSQLTVFASGKTTINIDTAKTSNAEDTAVVGINIAENCGISAITISITYDASLECIGFNEGIFSDYSVKDFADESYIRLVILEDADVKEDGLLISLNFKLKNAEKGKLYPVSIEYREGDFCNANGDAISPKIVSGGVAYSQEGTFSQTPSKYENSSALQSSAITSQNSAIDPQVPSEHENSFTSSPNSSFPSQTPSKNESSFTSSQNPSFSSQTPPKSESSFTSSQNPSFSSQTPPKNESSFTSIQSTPESSSTLQSGETTSSSTISSNSQADEENEQNKDTAQNELSTSQGLAKENSKTPKWVIIPISLVLVVLVFYVILRNKK